MSWRPLTAPVPGLIVPLIWSDSRVPSGSRNTRGNPVASHATPAERPVNRPNRTGPPPGAARPGRRSPAAPRPFRRAVARQEPVRPHHPRRRAVQPSRARPAATPANGAPVQVVEHHMRGRERQPRRDQRARAHRRAHPAGQIGPHQSTRSPRNSPATPTPPIPRPDLRLSGFDVAARDRRRARMSGCGRFRSSSANPQGSAGGVQRGQLHRDLLRRLPPHRPRSSRVHHPEPDARPTLALLPSQQRKLDRHRTHLDRQIRIPRPTRQLQLRTKSPTKSANGIGSNDTTTPSPAAPMVADLATPSGSTECFRQPSATPTQPQMNTPVR